MAATGPHKNTYIISDLVLGDTFEEWFTVTNTKIIDKLNRLKVYTATGNEGVTANTNDAGLVTIGLETIIPSDHTFTGNITFNGSTTTINSFDLNVDDYNLVLGDTGPGGLTSGDNDQTVGTGGSVGGGIIIRGSSSDKSILWKYPRNAFILSDHIGFSGTKGIGSVGNDFSILDMHTHGVSAGLQFGFTASTGFTGATTMSGPTAGNRDLIAHYRTQLGTAGTTHEVMRINSDAFVEITNGVNRKRITQTAHGFTFGNVLRRDFSTETDGYVTALATTKTFAEVVGIVSRVVDANTFDLTFSGEVVAGPGQSWAGCLTNSLTELSPGNAYFLSHNQTGKLSVTASTTPGMIRKPVITALDENRALVTNYIGHEVAAEDVLAAAGSSNRRVIEQINNFEVGDAVRFNSDIKYGMSGDSLWTGTEYENGTYQKAQANTRGEGEVIGIVSQTDLSGDHTKFYLTTGGFFSMPMEYGLTAGEVYFLSANSAGATSAKSLVTESPKTVGMVRKPLVVTSSSTECYFVNYVGTTITETINADRLQPLVGRTFSLPATGRKSLLSDTKEAGQWPYDTSGYSHGIIALNGNVLSRPAHYDNSAYDAWQTSSNELIPTNATHAVLTVVTTCKFNSNTEHRIYFKDYDESTLLSNEWKTADNRFGHLQGSYDQQQSEVQVVVPINATSAGSHIMYAVERSQVDGPLEHHVHLEGFYIDDSEVLVPNPSGTYRNKIINGNFDFWERAIGTSSSDTTTHNNYYSADRWCRAYSVGVGTPNNFSLQRGPFGFAQTDVPNYPSYFMRHSGQLTGSTGSTSYVCMEQRIEDVKTLSGKDATLSFYAKGTLPGKIHVALKQDFGSGATANNGQGGSDSNANLVGSLMTVDVGSNWSKYTGTIAVPTIGATANAGSDDHIALQFYTYLPTGSGAGNTVHIDYDGVLELSQVQLEEGEKSTPYDFHESQIELERCQRYFWSDTALSFYVDGTSGQPSTNQGNAVDTIMFPTTMRAAPGITVGTTSTTAAAAVQNIGTRSAILRVTTGSLGGADAQITGFQASAEL